MISDLLSVQMFVALGGNVKLLALSSSSFSYNLQSDVKEATLLFEKSRGCRPPGWCDLSHLREGNCYGPAVNGVMKLRCPFQIGESK